MLSGMGVRRASWGGAEITVSADSFTAFNAGADAVAQMIWGTDGTRDEKQNSEASSQVFASTDWIIPNGAASGTYRIRHTSETGDTGAPWAPNSSINVYSSLSAAGTYAVTDTTATVTTRSVTFNIQIDDGAGNVLSQASQTLTADREDF
jgi:hypothetical protein